MSERVLLFIPAYRCEKQIPRVLERFTAEDVACFAEVLVIENQSPDQTAEAASKAAEALAERTGANIKVLRKTGSSAQRGV